MLVDHGRVGNAVCLQSAQWEAHHGGKAGLQKHHVADHICLLGQEVEGGQEVGLAYKMSRPAPSHSFSSARFHSRKGSRTFFQSSSPNWAKCSSG